MIEEGLKTLGDLLKRFYVYKEIGLTIIAIFLLFFSIIKRKKKVEEKWEKVRIKQMKNMERKNIKRGIFPTSGGARK